VSHKGFLTSLQVGSRDARGLVHVEAPVLLGAHLALGHGSVTHRLLVLADHLLVVALEGPAHRGKKMSGLAKKNLASSRGTHVPSYRFDPMMYTYICARETY
jgi:hypothetical protein